MNLENRMVENDLDLGPIEERQLTLYRPAQSFYPTTPTKDAVFFIAATDVAALVAEVKRLREVETELRDRIDQMVYTCEH